MGSLHGVNHAPKLIVTMAACAAVAISAAGCGEKEEPATTGPVVTQSTTTTPIAVARTPSTTVKQFLTSPDAQMVCSELLTPSFVRKQYKGTKGCIAARKPSDLADRNPRLIVKRKGATATVVAKPRGGRYDGKTLQLTVLQQGNAFRIDALDVR